MYGKTTTVLIRRILCQAKQSYQVPVLNRRIHLQVQNKPETLQESFQFVGHWPDTEKETFTKDMIIKPDFITQQEEDEILKEIEPYLKRMKYEFDHWDDAIQGFRETERRQWYPANKLTLKKIMDAAFPGEQVLPHIHVLDLAEDGVIKPHVDSVRYCGTTIAGLSLLSDAIMRLVRIDETQYKDNADYRNTASSLGDKGFYVDILLKRRSLYIMSHTARYNFTHEVLSKSDSIFKSEPVDKTRRISVICRNEPKHKNDSEESS